MQTEKDFAQKIFTDVREMSKSDLGVTHLGYSKKETQVLSILKKSPLV